MFYLSTKNAMKVGQEPQAPEPGTSGPTGRNTPALRFAPFFSPVISPQPFPRKPTSLLDNLVTFSSSCLRIEYKDNNLLVWFQTAG